MPEEKIQNALEKLRSEINRLEGIEDPSRERLNSLINDIEGKSEQPEDTAPNLLLIERLTDEIAYFEISHPSLTATLNVILESLSSAGI
jgi:hypothetical protein